MNSGSRFKVWWVWLLVAAVIVACELAVVLSNRSSQSRLPISYSDFKQQVAVGNVPAVTMEGFTVTGSLRSPTALLQDGTTALGGIGPQSATAGTGSGAGGGNAGSQPVVVKDFSTTVPAVGDPTLFPLLDSKHVAVNVAPANGGSPDWLGAIAGAIIPALIIIGLMWFMTRRMGVGGQNQIFDFGRSKARRYNKEHPDVTFQDVAGVDQAKQELAEIVDFLRDPHRFSRLGGKMPKGIMLAGPPGTGKTLLAKAVAGEAHVPFFSLSGSEFVEMLVGVGASRVRDLFGQAKSSAPCIIFIDELDAVGRQRGAGLGGGHDEREQTLNQLLVEMDGFDPRLAIVVMAATNRPDVLDPALLRPGRFDRRVVLDRPDRVGRLAILKIHTRDVPLAPDVDLGVLTRATPGLVGADLANLINEAAILATRRNARQVAMRDFEAATDKVLIGPERNLVMDQHERRLVAYHEGGHALVALLLPKADPVHKVSIVPHGQALGITLQLPLDDRHNYPRDYLLARMAVMLGGRLAEEIVFGVPSTGAENDLTTVTKLARQMVGRWGMSSTVGRLAYSVGEEHPFLGREIGAPRDFSEETAALIDKEMRRIVEDLYSRTEQLLRAHCEQLERLADALLENETLDDAALKALFAGEIPDRVDIQEPAQAVQPQPEKERAGSEAATNTSSAGVVLGLSELVPEELPGGPSKAP